MPKKINKTNTSTTNIVAQEMAKKQNSIVNENLSIPPQNIVAKSISEVENASYISHSPVESIMLNCSDGGNIRVMQETWKYNDRSGNEQFSTKICVRPVFRKKDGKLYFSEPIANVKQDLWITFKKLVSDSSIS